MIKLVSQFDNERSKVSLATPTCAGCCCCCCCCLTSIITVSSLSARNFGRITHDTTISRQERSKEVTKSLVSHILLLLGVAFIEVWPGLVFVLVLNASFDRSWAGIIIPYLVIALLIRMAVLNKNSRNSKQAPPKESAASLFLHFLLMSSCVIFVFFPIISIFKRGIPISFISYMIISLFVGILAFWAIIHEAKKSADNKEE